MTSRRFFLLIPAAAIVGLIVSFSFHRYFDPAISSPPLAGPAGAASVSEPVVETKREDVRDPPKSKPRPKRTTHNRRVQRAAVVPAPKPVSSSPSTPADSAPVASEPARSAPVRSTPKPTPSPPAPSPPTSPNRNTQSSPAAAPPKKNSFYDSG
jgi:hypothetical protein